MIHVPNQGFSGATSARDCHFGAPKIKHSLSIVFVSLFGEGYSLGPGPRCSKENRLPPQATLLPGLGQVARTALGGLWALEENAFCSFPSLGALFLSFIFRSHLLLLATG